MAKYTDAQALDEVRKVIDPDGQQPDRLEWERRMFRNLAYLSGLQHFSQDPISGRLKQIPEVPGQRRHVDFTANMILPAVWKAVSKVLTVDGTFKTAPVTDSRQDREAAKIADKVFNAVRHDEDFKKKSERCELWAANTGLGVMKVHWDPDNGEPERLYTMSAEEKAMEGFGEVTGPVAANPDLGPDERKRKDHDGEFLDVSPGDITFDVVSPFAFFWDPDAKDAGIEGCSWVAQKTLMDIDKIKSRWGKKANKVKPDNYASYSTLYEESIALFHGGQASIGRTVPRQEYSGRDRATVIEYFEVASKANKGKGRYIVVAGKNTVLRNGDNPYATIGMPLPFVVFDWVPRPGGFVSIDLTGQLTDPQRAYNRSNAHMQDVEAQNGWPTLVVWKGSGVKSHRIANYAGAALEVNPSFGPPVQIPPAPLPPYISENAERRRREMSEISSMPEPGSGRGNVRGSKGIEMLLGEDNRVLDGIVSGFLRSVAECGTMALKLAGHFYTERRVTKVLGESNDWDVTAFTGADLRGSYDVRVVGEPGRVDGAAVRQAMVMDLVQAGFLDPKQPGDREMVLDTLYLKLPDQPFDDMLQDKRNAERENEMLIKVGGAMADAGPEMAPMFMEEMPIVRKFEEHETHVREHNRMRKTKEYRELPPPSQQLIDKHVQEHEQYVAEAMDQQIQLQLLMSQGGSQPAPKGEASQTKNGQQK